jgi:hypothetical protein
LGRWRLHRELRDVLGFPAVEKLEVFLLEVFDGFILRVAHNYAHDDQIACDFKVVRGLIAG